MENNSNPKVIDFSNDFAPVVGSTSSNVQEFKDTVSKMTDIFIAKNHDYGDSFSESVQELGPVAGFSVIMHKFNRLKNIIKGTHPLVEGESMEDTLLDMANYCIMLKMELEKRG